MKITNHKIDETIARFLEIDKTSGECKPGLPDTIVIHYTAGSSLDSAINTFKDPGVKASAHVVVGEEGEITQLIPFNQIGWHAGKSSWLDRDGLNPYSIGIEIVNAGRLEKSGSTWRSWFGKTFTEDEVIQAKHRNESKPDWWHVYSEKQITAVFQLCNELMKQYNIRYILGHEEISPGRKCDPGPAFPLDKLRERLLHSDRKEAEWEEEDSKKRKGTVTASALNIRSGPSANNQKIAEPLSRNTEVTILNEQNGWYNVEVKLKGWVSGQHIQE